MLPFIRLVAPLDDQPSQKDLQMVSCWKLNIVLYFDLLVGWTPQTQPPQRANQPEHLDEVVIHHAELFKVQQSTLIELVQGTFTELLKLGDGHVVTVSIGEDRAQDTLARQSISQLILIKRIIIPVVLYEA